MLEEYISKKVVIDLKSHYVCLGTLSQVDEFHLEIINADLHDLRDCDSTRENYIVSTTSTGIKRNRRRVVIMKSEVVAISLLKDVVYD